MRRIRPLIEGRWLLASALGCVMSGLVLIGMSGGTRAAGPGPAEAYEDAAAAVREIEWSPALERQIAALMLGRPAETETLEAVLAPARPSLERLAEAAAAPTWTTPSDPERRASRSQWEQAAWLLYADALLLMREGKAEQAMDKALLSVTLGRLISKAEGEGLSGLLTGDGLREAGLVQLMRLAAMAPPDPARAEALAGRIGPDPALPAARAAAIKQEALSVLTGLEGIADDPLPALGMGIEALPEAVRQRPAASLLDRAATEEALTAVFLDAAATELSSCAEPPRDVPPTILPFTQNPAGLVLVYQIETALARVTDRACATEATRRAAVLALAVQAKRQSGALPDELPEVWPSAGPSTDPFTGEPFLYLREEGLLVSAGQDRDLSGPPGGSPFDDAQPAFPLLP